jgi:hypothetical protein
VEGNGGHLYRIRIYPKNVAEPVSMDTFLLLHFAPNWKTTHLKSPRGFQDRLQGLRGLGSRNPHCSDGFSAGSRDSNASSIFFLNFAISKSSTLQLRSSSHHDAAQCTTLQLTFHAWQNAICFSTNPYFSSTNRTSPVWHTFGEFALFFLSRQHGYHDELSCRPYLTNELRLPW